MQLSSLDKAQAIDHLSKRKLSAQINYIQYSWGRNRSIYSLLSKMASVESISERKM